MYSYLKGTITEIEATSITLDVNNIGFLIKTPNPFSFKVGNEETIYTYQHVREDLIELYGFKNKAERDLFLKLINVKGLGPKGTLAIIAAGSVNDCLNAINNDNAKFFQSFPGIGLKLSQQIILDLKGKINFGEAESPMVNQKQLLVEQALKGLGYNAREIKDMTKQLPFNDQNIAISDLIKMALQRTII